MRLCHGWAKHPIRLSATRKYSDLEIREICRRHTGPFWLSVEDTPIRLREEICLHLACQVSAAYHNWVAYNAPEDDGFAADMLERERVVQARMEATTSSDDDANPP